MIPARCKIRSALAGLGIVFALAASASADVTIDRDTTINAATSFPGESVTVINGAMPPTTVRIVIGGQVGNSLFARDSSIINISGGIVGEDLLTLDNSLVSMSGGAIGEDMFATQDSRIELFGGTIGRDLFALDRGAITILGGTITRDLFAVDTGTISLFGGSIGRDLFATNNSVIHVYGFNLNYGDSLLTGTLLSGDLLNNEAFETENGRIILHEVDPSVIPEPAPWILIGTGLLPLAGTLLRRRRAE